MENKKNSKSNEFHSEKKTKNILIRQVKDNLKKEFEKKAAEKEKEFDAKLKNLEKFYALRRTVEEQEMENLYHYLASQEFSGQLNAILEGFKAQLVKNGRHWGGDRNEYN